MPCKKTPFQLPLCSPVVAPPLIIAPVVAPPLVAPEAGETVHQCDNGCLQASTAPARRVWQRQAAATSLLRQPAALQLRKSPVSAPAAAAAAVAVVPPPVIPEAWGER